MAGSTNDNAAISQTNSGFPGYLNFQELRTNAINYLGPITSAYWTDYNIHDPGITTLEVLLYAIMDLGYRANQPIASLLATNPDSTDTNFFTPAQILGCNPVTIVDYRKLLTDLTEVRNAWLNVDQSQPVDESQGAGGPFLNGIYQVWLELEMDLPDFATEEKWDHYTREVLRKAKAIFNAHRNVCEDVSSIGILTKKYIGVVADLEMIPGATASTVYQDVASALYAFFSPTPPFYTLGQLQQMGVPLDTVFEGRPNTGRPSHGFILDKDLPEQPSGDEPIYISAVYQAILAVSGVKTVRSLQLMDMDTGLLSGTAGEWIFSLTENSVPAFSLTGSTFRWYQNGQLLSTDLSSYNTILQMNAAHTGKVLYPAGPPALDATIPNATPLNGLSSYYSIQNDYPQVYGIGPGGLPSTVSNLRKSQALQFKAFLLFFDQLFADYLSQLSSLRQLFSLSAPTGAGGNTTYYPGDVSGTVPGFTELLRFPPAGVVGAAGGVAAGVGSNGSAAAGTVLLIPVAVKDWEDLIAAGAASTTGVPGVSGVSVGTVAAAGVAALSTYTFSSSGQRDVAVDLLTVLLYSAPPAVQTIQQDDKSWLYYLSGVSDEFVLISPGGVPTAAIANSQGKAALYVGATQANYNLISMAAIASYSFNLGQTASSYNNYLQTILEDPAGYTERRTDFLQHLMARFAESFTDYALLAAGFENAQQIAIDQTVLMERFLAAIPVLGSDRGKAPDYQANGWNNENTSGFEKRFKAYCGIADWRRHYLCNFEVHKYEDKFNVKMTLAGQDLFVCASPLLEEETRPAVHSLCAKLAVRENYRIVYKEDEKKYRLELTFYDKHIARSVEGWSDEPAAGEGADGLWKMWQLLPEEKDSWVSEYEYRPELLNEEGRVIRTMTVGYPDDQQARAEGIGMLERINDPEVWVIEPETAIGRLYQNQDAENPEEYMDTGGFRIYIQKDIVGKPDRCSFEVLDEQNTFRFRSKLDFETEAEARAASHRLLPFLPDARHYRIRKDPYGEIYILVIHIGGEDQAETEREWATEQLARRRIEALTRYLRQRVYRLRIVSRPFRWKYDFQLYLPGTGGYILSSKESFESREASLEAAHSFHRSGPGWALAKEKGGLALKAPGVGEQAVFIAGAGGKREDLLHLLKAKEEIYRISAGEKEVLDPLVVLDEPSKQGKYVYRLIDKDHPWAYHTEKAGERKEKAEADRDHLVLRGRKGYAFLEICLGGDNIRLGEGPGVEAGKYFYQLRCRNDYFSRMGLQPAGGELVLFESVIGYDSVDDAQTGFQQNYLLILEKARGRDNYGDKKFITLADRGDIIPEPGIPEPVVLVPLATRDVLNYAALDVIGELEKAAATYPVRAIGAGTKYRFVLGDGGKPDWESAAEFETAADAHSAFDFFRLLLNYPGNYFIGYDWADCRYRIGIREVLAESVGTYPDATRAWGPKGVQRMIGMAQSEGGFHPDMRKDCTYSYFIACRNLNAIHPCEYATAAQRDGAMQKLIHAAGNFAEKGWVAGHNFLQADSAGDEFSILDGKGRKLAKIPLLTQSEGGEAELNTILDLEDQIWAGLYPKEDEHGLFLQLAKDVRKIRPAAAVTAAEWIGELLDFAAYFPIVRNTTVKGGVSTAAYRLEVKLPGFVELPGKARSLKDCGCQPAEDSGLCYLAWKSETNFGKALDTWNAYLELLPLLRDKDNYRPVFGKETSAYGIELYPAATIVARNPQTYSYGAMAIQAIDRARACINAEGLDLVEHLLLRPEKSGGATITFCPDPGPCASSSFLPGGDPYSFIMTTALPAWPERFRKKENRVLLEGILQREAPAHVLLRILWLTPGDMCLFETYYEGWLNALGRGERGKDVCAAFHVDRFMDLLFKRSFSCLEDFTECGGVAASQPALLLPEEEWLTQINRLYCWADMDCADKAGWEVKGVAAGPPVVAGAPVVAGVAPMAILLTDERQIRRLIAARLNRYQKKIEDWQSGSGEQVLAGKAAAFMKDPEPSMKRLEVLLKELIKAEGKRKTKGHQVQALASIVLSFYLDKLSRDPEDENKWEHLQSTLLDLGLRIGSAEAYYTEWRPEEVRQIVSRLDEDKILSLLRAVQKQRE